MLLHTYNHNGTLLGQFEYSKKGLIEAYTDCVEYVRQTLNTATIKYGNTTLEVVTPETLGLSFEKKDWQWQKKQLKYNHKLNKNYLIYGFFN